MYPPESQCGRPRDRPCTLLPGCARRRGDLRAAARFRSHGDTDRTACANTGLSDPRPVALACAGPSTPSAGSRCEFGARFGTARQARHLGGLALSTISCDQVRRRTRLPRENQIRSAPLFSEHFGARAVINCACRRFADPFLRRERSCCRCRVALGYSGLLRHRRLFRPRSATNPRPFWMKRCRLPWRRKTTTSCASSSGR